MPDGTAITLEVIDYIPYLRERESLRAAVAMPSPVALPEEPCGAPQPARVRPRHPSPGQVPVIPSAEEPRAAGSSYGASESAPPTGGAEDSGEDPGEESPEHQPESEASPEWPDGVPMSCGTCGHGSGKETRRLKAEAKSWKHQLTHLPKNPYCWACVLGKLTKKRARKKGDLEDGAVEFGEKVTTDDIISAGDSSGIDGATIGKHFLDLGTRWKDLYPSATKAKVDAVQAMQHFAGENDK